MRKITREAVRAFRNREKFNQGNTSVSINDDGAVCLLLHGNLIAIRYADGEQELEVSSAGWETVTTKERLNGLLHAEGFQGIYQDNFTWYWEDGTPFGDGWQVARE